MGSTSKIQEYNICAQSNISITFLNVSNVSLKDVIRPMTLSCTILTTEFEEVIFRTRVLRAPERPDGVLFCRLGDGEGCNRRQDTPTTVFLFAIAIIKSGNL